MSNDHRKLVTENRKADVSKRQLSKSFTSVFRPLSTPLIKSHFHLQRRTNTEKEEKDFASSSQITSQCPLKRTHTIHQIFTPF